MASGSVWLFAGALERITAERPCWRMRARNAFAAVSLSKRFNTNGRSIRLRAFSGGSRNARQRLSCTWLASAPGITAPRATTLNSVIHSPDSRFPVSSLCIALPRHHSKRGWNTISPPLYRVSVLHFWRSGGQGFQRSTGFKKDCCRSTLCRLASPRLAALGSYVADPPWGGKHGLPQGCSRARESDAGTAPGRESLHCSEIIADSD